MERGRPFVADTAPATTKIGLERHPLTRLSDAASQAPIVVHGFMACPASRALMAWCHEHRIAYDWIDHPDRAERQRWYDVQEQTRDEWGVAGGISSRTMPQVFVDGVCLGVSAETVMRYEPALMRWLAGEVAGA